MSQVFSADAVQNTTTTNLVTTTPAIAVTGNFLNPPFGNAKAIINATANIGTGTAATFVSVQIRRNPNAENLPMGNSVNITAVGGTSYALHIQAVDVIPDGRAVQYALQVNQAGASGNGTVGYASISAILISG